VAWILDVARALYGDAVCVGERRALLGGQAQQASDSVQGAAQVARHGDPYRASAEPPGALVVCAAMRWIPLLLGVACGPASGPPVTEIAAAPRVIEPVVVEETAALQAVDSAADYRAAVTEIEARRVELAERWAVGGEREAVLDEARELVFRSLTHELIPAWYGTPWDFYGTSQVPGQGQIACGYLVSTVLRDAGFRVERVRLAQQASERIIQTLVRPETIARTSRASAARALRPVTEGEDGIWLVGLDYHVGFVVKRGERVQMCHASYLDDALALCEDAATSPAFVSRYRVLGRLLQDPMLQAWLEGRALPTYLGG